MDDTTLFKKALSELGCENAEEFLSYLEKKELRKIIEDPNILLCRKDNSNVVFSFKQILEVYKKSICKNSSYKRGIARSVDFNSLYEMVKDIKNILTRENNLHPREIEERLKLNQKKYFISIKDVVQTAKKELLKTNQIKVEGIGKAVVWSLIKREK